MATADSGGAEVAAGSGTPAARSELWIALGILALLSAVCCAPLLAGGWFDSHEKIRPIARALGAWHEVAAGDLYPRWVSTAYLGKGAPLFNFYPPAFSLLAAYLHALGVPLLVAMKLLIFLLFFVGAVGTYLWTRPHLGHLAALVAAVLYLFAPYHFVDVYVRGAVAEFAALAPLPFLFRAVDMLLERTSARGLALLAFASTGVVTSHFLGALMVAPFAVAYAVVRTVQARGGWAAMGRVAAGGALGAAISACYWLPALTELNALSAERLETNNSGYLSPYVHFVRPWQWLDTKWGFGASVPDGYVDEMSFQLGLLVVFSVVATVLLLRPLGRQARRFALLSVALGCGALWLTTAASRPWYALLKPYEMVQFPWRFLGVATLFAAAAGAGFARVLAERWRTLGTIAVAATIVAAVALSAPHRKVSAVLPLSDDTAALDQKVAEDPWSAKYGNSDEYLPKDAGIDAANFKRAGSDPWGIGAEVGSVRKGRSDVTFEVTAPAGDGIAVVPWHAFPGWKATLDGRDWKITPGPDGLIALWVPQGRHVARVRFGTTPPRLAGWALVVCGLATLVAIAVRERRRRGRAPSPG